MTDIVIEIIININNCTKTFKVSFQWAPPIIEEGTDKINFNIYPDYIPLYIYKIDKHGKYNLEQINNTNISESPNNNLFITPFDINDINPINLQNNLIKFLLKEKEKKIFFIY